jgi:carbon starvation protein CstA
VLLGLGVIAGGVADFLGLLGPHRRSSGLTQVLNDLLGALVGPTGALVLWLVVGLVFVALGFFLRRLQKTGHGE